MRRRLTSMCAHAIQSYVAAAALGFSGAAFPEMLRADEAGVFPEAQILSVKRIEPEYGSPYATNVISFSALDGVSTARGGYLFLTLALPSFSTTNQSMSFVEYRVGEIGQQTTNHFPLPRHGKVWVPATGKILGAEPEVAVVLPREFRDVFFTVVRDVHLPQGNSFDVVNRTGPDRVQVMRSVYQAPNPFSQLNAAFFRLHADGHISKVVDISPQATFMYGQDHRQNEGYDLVSSSHVFMGPSFLSLRE